MSYFSARLAEFAAASHADMYGDTFTFNGTSYTCLSDAQEQLKVMQANNYQQEIPARFDMLATDFAASGLAVKSRIESNGHTFEVYSITEDPKEPTVWFRANRKQ